MKWKIFFQITLLIIITAIALYIVYPKYYFETAKGDRVGMMRANKITGKVEQYALKEYGWQTIGNEKSPEK